MQELQLKYLKISSLVTLNSMMCRLEDIMRQVDTKSCQNISWNEFKTSLFKVLKVKAGNVHKHKDK